MYSGNAPLLPKEYRFLRGKSRGGEVNRLDFCCYFSKALSVSHSLASSPKGGAHGGFPYRCKNLPLSGEVALRSNDGEGYSLPHCRPVKKRSVVLARKTFPARSSVLGNSE